MALLQKLQDFFASPAVNPAVETLYRACVTQARRPEFYREFGVPDTIDGRFDLLVLHVFLVMRHIAEHPEIRQQLFDLMFADMDQNLREMGVGDMSIGKKMKAMIAAFYGRAQSYENALKGDDEALEVVLVRNLFGAPRSSSQVVRSLAAYVRRCDSMLRAQSQEKLLAGHVEFSGPL